MTDPEDEPTIRVPRAGAQSEEDTAVSKMRGSSRADDATAKAGDWVTTAASARSGSSSGPDGMDTGGGVTEDDGSTVVARRESRRRQARASAARPAPGASDGGSAEPDALPGAPDRRRAVSAVRNPAPVIVPRASPTPRAPQPYVDTAGQEAARLRRSRQRAAMIVAAASGITLLAAGALIVLTTLG